MSFNISNCQGSGFLKTYNWFKVISFYNRERERGIIVSRSFDGCALCSGSLNSTRGNCTEERNVSSNRASLSF